MNNEFIEYLNKIGSKDLSKLYDAFLIIKRDVSFYAFESSEMNFEQEYKEQLFILDYFGIINFNSDNKKVELLANPIEVLEYKKELESKMGKNGMFIFN